MKSKILALDLGTLTGYSLGEYDGSVFTIVHNGTWELATEKELKFYRKYQNRNIDPRFWSLYIKVLDLLVGNSNEKFTVAYEDVLFSVSTAQTQLWATLRAAVWAAIKVREYRVSGVVPVPVQTIKKFATGSGAADKKFMRIHLLQKHPEIRCDNLDDNAIDAIWLRLYIESKKAGKLDDAVQSS